MEKIRKNNLKNAYQPGELRPLFRSIEDHNSTMAISLVRVPSQSQARGRKRKLFDYFLFFSKLVESIAKHLEKQ